MLLIPTQVFYHFVVTFSLLVVRLVLVDIQTYNSVFPGLSKQLVLLIKSRFPMDMTHIYRLLATIMLCTCGISTPHEPLC